MAFYMGGIKGIHSHRFLAQYVNRAGHDCFIQAVGGYIQRSAVLRMQGNHISLVMPAQITDIAVFQLGKGFGEGFGLHFQSIHFTVVYISIIVSALLCGNDRGRPVLLSAHAGEQRIIKTQCPYHQVLGFHRIAAFAVQYLFQDIGLRVLNVSEKFIQCPCIFRFCTGLFLRASFTAFTGSRLGIPGGKIETGMIIYHKTERQGILAFIQVNISLAVNQGVQIGILLRGFGKHVSHRKKGRGKRGSPVKTVKYLAVAHSQLFIEFLHMAVCRGREQGSGGIADHSPVIFSHPAEFLKPVKIRILFTDTLHQNTVIIMVFQIFAAAGDGNTGLIHVYGGFRGHGKESQDGKKLQAEASFFIIIQENTIET